MSGGNVPYHLRPNKYVERRLFIELLEQLDRWRSIRDAAYISMGGWLLEDHKMIHDRFDTKLLVSLESDDVVHARQVYNAPLGFINCTREDTATFVENFDAFAARHPNVIRVIWFDYASAGNRQGQLREAQMLISKLDAGDVLKMTMNASQRTLCDWDDIEDPKDRQAAALEGLSRKLGPYMPAGVDARRMTDEGLAAVLLEAIRKAVLDGVSASPNLVVRPLTAFRYSDGPHQMVTATVVLVEASELSEFETKTRLAEWPMALAGWGPVHAIKVPDLSLRERFHIDAKLFVQADAMVHAALPFKFHKELAESFGIFQDYVKHYRRYPSYIRIGQ